MSGRYLHIRVIIFGIYILFVSGAYLIFLTPLVNKILTPTHLPHDENFVSKIHQHRSQVTIKRHTRNFILVTAASAQFVDRLENLIGSIHYHEPHLSIVVFDLGMTDRQLSRISCIVNVQIELFPFEIYPSHVEDLHLFAYKALLLKEAFKRYGSQTQAIFFLDAGSEIRSSLDPVVEAIETRGYFFTRQKTLIVNHTHEQTFAQLNTSKNDFTNNQYQTAAGILGFSTLKANHSGFYKDILLPFIACSLKPDCIAPHSSSASSHRFDQSVLSILVHKAGYDVSDDERFYGDFGTPHGFHNSMIIFSRRWHCPKVYTTEIVYRQICNYQPLLRRRHHQTGRVRERDNAYSCGTLALVAFDPFFFELPYERVHQLVFVCFVIGMGLLYFWMIFLLRFSLSMKKVKERIV